MKGWLSGLLLMMMLSSCSEVQERPPLVISTDTWIGLSPLYYAHSQGWLKKINVELLKSESINDNIEHYTTGAADIVSGTVHEYKRLKTKYPNLIPIIIYDRSYGGDVILSNKTLTDIRQGSEKIDIYLEGDTVSEEMLDYFLADNNLTSESFTLYNRSQSEIERLNASSLTSPVIVITYNPYDTVLKKQGFSPLATSKDNRYLIVDGIYVSSKLENQNYEQLKKLKEVFGRAVQAYHQNPKAFYEIVKPYLGNPKYEEFETMVANIQWTHDQPLSHEMLQQLQQNNFPINGLI